MRIGRIVGIPSLDINGHAGRNGFYLEKGKKVVTSRNYSPKEYNTKFTMKHLFVWLGIWAFYVFLLLSILSYFSLNGWLSIVLFSLLASVVGYCAWLMIPVLFLSEFHGRAPLEYHACEHKVAMLLTEKLPPTLENLKKMPRVALSCSTNSKALMGTLPLIFVIELILYNILLEIHSDISTAVIVLMTCLLCSALPSLLQFFFTTRQPSEEKLKEALEIAKEFYKERSI